MNRPRVSRFLKATGWLLLVGAMASALLLSPLLLLAWIVWRLARSLAAPPGPGATIGA